LATKKKCEFLSKAVNNAPAGSNIVSVSCHVKGKDDTPSAVQDMYQQILKHITGDKDNGQNKLILGVLDKEWDMNSKSAKGNATLVQGWQSFLTAKQVDRVDVSAGIGVVMATKDTEEMDIIRKSSILTNKILKHGFIPRLEEIIEKEIPISHEALSNEIEDMIDNPSKIQLKVPQEHVQSCYNPIVQSGGEYDLRVSAQSNNNTLKYDVITVSFGSRYQLYCSNLARTFLVDPPKSVKESYEILVLIQDACIAAMKPGNPLKAVYAAAVQKLEEEKRQDLIDKLPKNLGFSIGLDFREPAMVLTPKNNAIIRSGMIFNLSLGFSDLTLNKSDIESAHEKSAVRHLLEYNRISSIFNHMYILTYLSHFY
jgi:nucleosome binding factor SPN SPT16 subunit